jgi:hypothetical protein
VLASLASTFVRAALAALLKQKFLSIEVARYASSKNKNPRSEEF